HQTHSRPSINSSKLMHFVVNLPAQRLPLMTGICCAKTIITHTLSPTHTHTHTHTHTLTYSHKHTLIHTHTHTHSHTHTNMHSYKHIHTVTYKQSLSLTHTHTHTHTHTQSHKQVHDRHYLWSQLPFPNTTLLFSNFMHEFFIFQSLTNKN